MKKADKETWEDAVGRSAMARELILDTNPGMLDMMTEGTYPEQKGKHPAMGEDILDVARTLG